MSADRRTRFRRSAGKRRARPARPGISRRHLLAMGAGAAGGTLVGGFPTVWAQDTQNIVLNHTGISYSITQDLAIKASRDLPFTVSTAVAHHNGIAVRMATEPGRIDIADYEVYQRVLTVPRRVHQAIDPKRIALWDKIAPLFTEGTFGNQTVSREGISPFEVMYFTNEKAAVIADGPTDWAIMLPGVYNADTIGIRPDAIGRPVEYWRELLNPDFADQAAAQDNPPIGIIDIAIAIESRGDLTYGDKGNMTRFEIDKTIEILIDLKRRGHWHALWRTPEESVRLMASGSVVIQPMWSPAVTAVRAFGIPCYYAPLAEGYRCWANGLSLMRHLSGKRLGAAYDYLNWYCDGWAGAHFARQGYYIGVAETARKHLSKNEWDYWYGGKAATETIVDVDGNPIESVGHVRDGGSYENRFGNIACWNTLMDEHQYLLRRWADFRAA